MSSGSNAVTPRKPNVASTLFKPASSTRFQLHGQAGSKSMKRQRPGGGASYDRDVLSAESVSNAAALLGERRESVSTAGVKSKKRFVGVRQRPSGRWVAEIKDTTQKIRLWLGTFDSAEEGAKAYDSAARALRGANTRTNFVPAMACEGTTAPASKAARLIRLRQMTAASKEAARNADHHSSLKGRGGNVKEEPQVNDSLAQMVRQELQQSTVSSLDPSLPSPAIIDDHTPNLPPAPAPAPAPAPSSPPKPPRLIGRRHYVAPQLASPNPEQEGDDDAPPFAPDHGTVDNGSPCMKLEVVDPPPKLLLESQQSVTSNAINPNLIVSSRQDSSSPPPLSFPSPRSPFDCVQQPSCTFMADGGTVQSVNSSPDHLKERFLTHPPPVELSFAPVAPPIPNFHALEASRQLMFRSDNNIISGLVAFSHHQLSSCATNRDHMSMTYSREKDEVGRSLRSSMDHGPMSLGDGIVTSERRASTVRCCNEEMDYGSSEISRMEAERKSSIDRAILREKEFGELQEPEIPWADYVLMDETGMDSGLLGLDLSCENSGVYNSAFDFSVEAIDRDSCTSVMLEHEHLSDDSEFLLRMQYEQSCNSPNQSTFPQGCVLLTEPNSERDFTMSSTPQEPAHSLPMLWHMDDASACWDGQSSGSTETIVDLKPTTGDGDGGECTSQDHEALWSSMDLPPLCMVA